MTAQLSPIKVDKATKERIRLAAAVLGIAQGEFVRRLVAEYVATNGRSLRERVEEARAALLDGDDAMIAYLRDDGDLTVADFRAAGGGVA